MAALVYNHPQVYNVPYPWGIIHCSIPYCVLWDGCGMVYNPVYPAVTENTEANRGLIFFSSFTYKGIKPYLQIYDNTYLFFLYFFQNHVCAEHGSCSSLYPYSFLALQAYPRQFDFRFSNGFQSRTRKQKNLTGRQHYARLLLHLTPKHIHYDKSTIAAPACSYR